LSNDVVRQLDSDAELSAQLLARIPNLHDTAETIRLSTRKPRELLAIGGWEGASTLQKAAIILRLMRESPTAAQNLLNAPTFVTTRLQELYGLSLAITPSHAGHRPHNAAELTVLQMTEGTILLEDIRCRRDGRMLAGAGFTLTESSLLLLSRFIAQGEIDTATKYRVSVPS
jgi:hypothetical protein